MPKKLPRWSSRAQPPDARHNTAADRAGWRVVVAVAAEFLLTARAGPDTPGSPLVPLLESFSRRSTGLSERPSTEPFQRLKKAVF